MSWSFQIPKTPIADFEATADAAAASYKAGLAVNDWQPTEDAGAGIDEAIAAAKAIANSGVVGKGNVTATLAGHASPGNVPGVGTSPPTVTVTVTCADVYVTPEAAAQADAIVAEEQATSLGKTPE